MIIFLLGGSKSKKSYYGEIFAEGLRNTSGDLYYLATMKPYDRDDLDRIERHIKDREGHGYNTIEKEKDILEIINIFNGYDTVLLDSITSLITNEMFLGNRVEEVVHKKIITEVIELSKKVANLVIVSDYLFNDAIIYDDFTDVFIREMGKVNLEIAKIADIVVESSFGNLIYHKGKEVNRI